MSCVVSGDFYIGILIVIMELATYSDVLRRCDDVNSLHRVYQKREVTSVCLLSSAVYQHVVLVIYSVNLQTDVYTPKLQMLLICAHLYVE